MKERCRTLPRMNTEKMLFGRSYSRSFSPSLKSSHQKDLQGRKKNHRLDFPVACFRFNLETAVGREKAVQGIYAPREL